MGYSNPDRLESIAVYTAAPWEMALVTVRVTGPAGFAGVKVLQGKTDGKISLDAAHLADLIVIQRDFPRYWDAYLEILAIARRENKPIVFEIDDLLFELPTDHSHRHEYLDALLPMVHVALIADLVTVSTVELGDYMRCLNPNVVVVQNYLNDRIWRFKPGFEKTIHSNVVSIGYMGGETHGYDLEEISPALIRILESYSGKVRFRIMGGKPPQNLLNHPDVEWIPINQLNYVRFADAFLEQDWDIFISPLRDDPFNQAKSGLKFLEYSTHGLPGVYSRLTPYESIVIDGQTGFLAGDLKEWEGYLARLIEQPELRRQLGYEAQKTVIQKWLLSKNYSAWLKAYQQAFNRELIKSHPRDAKLLSSILEQAQLYCQMRDHEANNLYRELIEIYESRSWKAMQKIHRVRAKIFPKS